MELRIKLNLDNAAFEDDQGAEVARILAAYAASIESGELNGFDLTATLRDVNGNKVGTAVLVR